METETTLPVISNKPTRGMFVTKPKLYGKLRMTCKFVKKFLLAMLVIHKRQHSDMDDQVTSAVGAEANYALYSEEIAENEANEALLTSLNCGEGTAAAAGLEAYQYPVQCVETVDGCFYWDTSMQRLPVDEDFIEVHVSSFSNSLTNQQL